MTLNSKLAGARAILEAHNSSSTKPVDVEGFFTRLTDMGGSSEDALISASWEDLEMCGAPRILARRIAAMFRGDQQQEPQFGSPQRVILEETDPDKLAKAMTPAQLIAVYDPKQPKSAVGERLKFLSEGKKFLVFNDDGTINQALSCKLIDELDDHGEVEEYVSPEGDVSLVCAVGERPDRTAMEHPLFPGTALRNGLSECGCDWSNINPQIAQTLYLAVTETKEIDMNVSHEADVYDLAVGSGIANAAKSLAQINRRCIQAAKLFKERAALGKLPSLRKQSAKLYVLTTPSTSVKTVASDG